MPIEYRFASTKDKALFNQVDEDVFDEAISAVSLHQFLTDERHHIVVAIDEGHIVGFVSAVDYFHPDKPHELWLNEVGVAATWRQHGIASRLLTMMFDHGRSLGCQEAWVLTEPDNLAANRLYRSVAEAAETSPMTTVVHRFRLS
ncbi:GNAT family N-acetyltransferase [Alteripontixanthobacter maritimus]|uniref:GNAT family N-acetyltransferase n=1 Tax=Alteripontixanthobacter maritimus TaxID=2161824 RepID=UPI000E1C256A|nr:GNAT family N-acetyltransferase [Alteripontixanthobacter maritimus]